MLKILITSIIFVTIYCFISNISNKKKIEYNFLYDDDNNKILPILPQKIVNNLYLLLQLVTCELKSSNIPYVIVGGTLLGSVRHGGLIPWDYDVDISVFEPLENIKKILEPLKKIKCFFSKDRGILKVKFINGTGILDIFKMEKIGKLYDYEYPYNLKYDKHYFTESELYPLKQHKFGPLMLDGPNDAISHLNRAYPDWPNKVVIDWSDEFTKLVENNDKIREKCLKTTLLPN